MQMFVSQDCTCNPIGLARRIPDRSDRQGKLPQSQIEWLGDIQMICNKQRYLIKNIEHWRRLHRIPKVRMAFNVTLAFYPSVPL